MPTARQAGRPIPPARPSSPASKPSRAAGSGPAPPGPEPAASPGRAAAGPGSQERGRLRRQARPARLREGRAGALRRRPAGARRRAGAGCGWQVRISSWVVGVRLGGMIDENSVSEILDFLQVTQDWRAKIAEDMAIKSVKALHLLYQMCCQALRLNMYKASTRFNKMEPVRTIAVDQQGTIDTDESSTSCTWKRRGHADDGYGEPQLRWKKMASVARVGS